MKGTAERRELYVPDVLMVVAFDRRGAGIGTIPPEVRRPCPEPDFQGHGGATLNRQQVCRVHLHRQTRGAGPAMLGEEKSATRQ
jgi:hypothetical protein